MTTENKLIAEFMGYSQLQFNYPSTTYWYKQGKEPLAILSFDRDWNCLMEVVEKIESLNYSLEINKQEKLDYQCLITQKNNIIIQKFNTIKIQAVYQAVVEFINQLNNN
jgi:hypothetical protein